MTFPAYYPAIDHLRVKAEFYPDLQHLGNLAFHFEVVFIGPVITAICPLWLDHNLTFCIEN